MEQDQLLELAKKFVETKVPYASDDVKEEMAIEVKDKIEETIRLQLVSQMTPDQVDAYTELLEQDNVTDEMIISFINRCNINVDEVTQVALTRFRIAYLGA